MCLGHRGRSQRSFHGKDTVNYLPEADPAELQSSSIRYLLEPCSFEGFEWSESSQVSLIAVSTVTSVWWTAEQLTLCFLCVCTKPREIAFLRATNVSELRVCVRSVICHRLMWVSVAPLWVDGSSMILPLTLWASSRCFNYGAYIKLPSKLLHLSAKASLSL